MGATATAAALTVYPARLQFSYKGKTSTSNFIHAVRNQKSQTGCLSNDRKRGRKKTAHESAGAIYLATVFERDER